MIIMKKCCFSCDGLKRYLRKIDNDILWVCEHHDYTFGYNDEVDLEYFRCENDCPDYVCVFEDGIFKEGSNNLRTFVRKGNSVAFCQKEEAGDVTVNFYGKCPECVHTIVLRRNEANVLIEQLRGAIDNE